MEIRRISPQALSIYLNDADLDELDISYEALDILCPHTRLVIRQLLETALAQTGFDPGDRHLLIEAYPVEEDGCLLLFTLSDTHKNDRAESAEPTLYLFSDFKELRHFCRQLAAASSALYWQDGQYILSLAGVSPLPEGRKAADSALLLAELQEHDCLLIRENAVEKLNQAFN